MVFINPETEFRRREREWDFFQIPYSLREKLERDDLIEISRKYHAWVVDYFDKLKHFEEHSLETLKKDKTPVLQKMVA